MALRRRKARDRYLDMLASDPLFRGVARPYIVVIGRLVEMLELAPGDTIGCDPARETVIVASGYVLVTDSAGSAVGAVGPGSAVAAGRCRVVAATSVRVFIVGRRELPTVAALAPAVARLNREMATFSERNATPRVATVQPR
jgi:hypothetical protein